MITRKDIIDGLKKLKLKRGDHVIVHCALSSFGQVRGGADTVIDAILEVVGSGGTLVVPAFGSGDKVFDPEKSGTNLGVVPQTLLARKGVYRSRHPLASVAAIGGKASWLTEKHEEAEISHGRNTPYYKLTEVEGKILLLGVDQDRNTFLHTIEALVGMPYLRTCSGSYLDENGKPKSRSWANFPGPHRNFIGLQFWMESSGLTIKVKIGNSIAQVMAVNPLREALTARLSQKPGLFITENHNLSDGVWQRADLFRAELKKESFTLCPDSQFAGRYIEQIVENLKRFGIDNIVLSYVNNVPWNRVEQRERKWYLQGLKHAGIKVAAIRLLHCDADQGLMLLQEAKASLIILPSTVDAAAVKKIGTLGYTVTIENLGMPGEPFADMIYSYQKTAKDVKAAFNPLAFTHVAEAPFTVSYKRLIKAGINSLLINDGLATGERTQLGQGLAEIKELMSIIRCRSFNGLFILEAESYKTFHQNTVNFFNILKELGECPSH
ncbi:MAG: AAC(3) family N-acetyltransferase [Spirochaetales bacterium]|nr:AAC(3) family N-acetyltransferase [Spirochaetales bacterium]